MFLPLPLSVSAIKGRNAFNLGIRGSAEVVGTAVLTFGVSLLIRFGWQAAFLVYGISIPILLLYLLFVPYGSKTEAVEEKHKDVKMTQRYARVTQKKLFEDMDKFIAATEKDFVLAL